MLLCCRVLTRDHEQLLIAVELVEEPDFHFHASRRSHRAVLAQPSMDGMTFGQKQGLRRF